jgi:peptidoglycan/LPS O-acetylase OafA/YrhL
LITERQIQSNKHFPELDGLRGIAILMVIAFHYFPNVYFLKFGWSGVDLFFVLSGFLISSRLIPFINDKGILLQFYRNRLLRIIPLYFTFLISFFLFWFFFANKDTVLQNPFYTNNWYAFFLFIQNWIYIHFPEQPLESLNHFWSLAVEEQFYIFFPIFILLTRKPKRILAIALVLIFIILLGRSLYYFVFSTNYQSIYWNTFFRADSFLIGSVVFIIFNYYNNSKELFKTYIYYFFASVILIVSGAIFYKSILMSNPSFQTFGYTCISVIFGYILLQSINSSNHLLSRMLSNSTLQYLGKISYGLYIFHWPIYFMGFGILNKIFKNHYINYAQLNTLNICCSILITFLISHLSYKYFESYFLNLKKKLRISKYK